MVAGIFDCATRLTAVEQAINGRSPDAIDAVALGKIAGAMLPIYGDQRMSSEYKTDLIEAHTSRAVAQALARSAAGLGGQP